jgi:malate/lactate dehydrogenase
VKVTMVGGAGGVGSSAVFNLALAGLDCEVVVVDPREEMITSHVMDLEQTLELSPGCSIRRGDKRDVADADVLVISAAVPLTVNASRLVYAADNARILDSIADLVPAGWNGVAVVVTNPVDPLVTRFRRRTGLDRRRVLGYTLNDSLRLRTGIAKALGVAPASVDAWVVGEHGDSSVLLFDRVRVDGAPATLTGAQAAAAEEYVRTWYVRHVALDSGRSSTWTSGLGVARMVAALVRPELAIWPASLVLDGEYGIADVAVSVPVTLGPGGAEEIHEWELAADDLSALRGSAELVREVAAGIDGPVATGA